jgi:urea transport system permease protein
MVLGRKYLDISSLLNFRSKNLLSTVINSVFGGISVGSVLMIAALGLAIVYGLMGVINMAHGELMTIGAYTTYVIQNVCKGTPLQDFYIFPALIAAFIVVAGLGFLLERWVIRYLYGRPLETLLATWGVSLILQQFVRSISWQMTIGIGIFTLLFVGGKVVLTKFRGIPSIVSSLLAVVYAAIALGVSSSIGSSSAPLARPWFGAQGVNLTAPSWLLAGVDIGGERLPGTRIFIILLTILCVTAVYFFLDRSQWGLRIRAVTQNRSMSACLGIPTQQVDALTFALGSGLAGIAGVAVTLLGSTDPTIGSSYIIDAFMVVVIGGVGKLVGSIVAALVLGVANYSIAADVFSPLFSWAPPLADFFKFFSNSSMAKVMVFTAIFIFLQIRPAGLFPQKGRTVEN